MSLARSTMKGAAVVGASQVAIAAIGFLRNVLIARMLGPADFGIAATFALTMATVELLSQVSVDKLIVQAPDGDSPTVQATAHSILIARGIVGAIVVFTAAPLIGWYFNAPETTWAFRWLSLVPLSRGFLHLDSQRLQRHMAFVRSALVESVPQIVATAAAWPLVRLTGDYSGVLWIVLTTSAATLVMSHLVAERRYSLAWDNTVVQRVIAFGWPLLLNGFLLLATQQGDRFVIGRSYTKADLGAYTVAVSLASAPTAMIAAASTTLLLPLLSRCALEQSKFTSRVQATTWLMALCGILVGCPLVAAGNLIVRSIYGAAYSDAGTVLGWIVLAQAFRMLRQPQSLAALARGDSLNLVIANIARACALAFAIVTAWLGASIVWVAIASAMGECFGLKAASVRLSRRHGIAERDTWIPICVVTGWLFASAVAGVWIQPLVGPIGAAFIGLVIVALAVGSVLSASPQLRTHGREIVTASLSRVGILRAGAGRVLERHAAPRDGR